MITDLQKVKCFDVVLFELIGGKDNLELAIRHYEDGMSFQEIGSIVGMERMAVCRKVSAVRKNLERCGLWPRQWEARDRKAG